MAISKKLLCTLLIAALACSLLPAKSKKKKSGLKTAAAEVSDSKERGAEDEEEENPDAAWQYLEWEEEYPEYVLKYEIAIEEKKDEKRPASRSVPETFVKNVTESSGVA